MCVLLAGPALSQRTVSVAAGGASIELPVGWEEASVDDGLGGRQYRRGEARLVTKALGEPFELRSLYTDESDFVEELELQSLLLERDGEATGSFRHRPDGLGHASMRFEGELAGASGPLRLDIVGIGTTAVRFVSAFAPEDAAAAAEIEAIVASFSLPWPADRWYDVYGPRRHLLRAGDVDFHLTYPELLLQELEGAEGELGLGCYSLDVRFGARAFRGSVDEAARAALDARVEELALGPPAVEAPGDAVLDRRPARRLTATVSEEAAEHSLEVIALRLDGGTVFTAAFSWRGAPELRADLRTRLCASLDFDPPAPVHVDAGAELPSDFRRLEPGVRCADVHVDFAGRCRRLWVYLPEARDGPLPLVLTAPAGTNLLHGQGLDEGSRTEHLRYARAGYAVVAYALQGELVEDSYEGFYFAAESFVAAGGGRSDAGAALRYAQAHLPVDPTRVYAAGHGSAGTVALVAAAHHPEVRACIAYAAPTSLAAFSPRLVDFVRETVPGSAAFFENAEPERLLARLRCPVYLFHALDDDVVPAGNSRRFRELIEQAGGQATLETVEKGGHYDAMIERGIPLALAWLARHR